MEDLLDIEERFKALIMSDIDFGPYYWQTPETKLPLWRKSLQWSLWASEKTLQGAEFVGEVVANIFGMDESKYQWVIDAAREDEERKKRRRVEDEQRRELDLGTSRSHDIDGDATLE